MIKRKDVEVALEAGHRRAKAGAPAAVTALSATAAAVGSGPAALLAADAGARHVERCFSLWV